MAKLALVEGGIVTSMGIGELANAPAGFIDVSGTACGMGWTDNGNGTFTDNQPGIRQISIMSFRKRFTLAEKVAIEESVDSTVKVFSADLAAATFIDLDDADTIAGIAYLTSIALLAAGRDAVILADGTEIEV